MDNIIVLTQNLKLESIAKLKSELAGSETLILSTQFIFENEAKLINEQLGVRCTYKNFSDILTDADWDYCDTNAFSDQQKNVDEYYSAIKTLKNQMIANKVLSEYACNNKIIVCDDLGLDANVWISKGFRYIRCEYYHESTSLLTEKSSLIIKAVSKFSSKLRTLKNVLTLNIWKISYNGQTYLFFGSLNRIGYRCNMEFKKASRLENVKAAFYMAFKAWPSNKIVRMSTLHESTSIKFPDIANLNLKLIQDGYLPPNYSSKYLLFNGKNIEYYTWDVAGQVTFKYHQLKSQVMPFRKKLYLPNPVFPQRVKKVLCVASGAGDWTAVKNRSDEDKMVHAFGKIAAMFPDIEFVYRCHPVWVHPQHQGVNSINRVAEYVHWLSLPNFKISCHIPNAVEKGKFVLSYKRTSFEEDLKDVDVVFGEHSISMIDAAFKSILFCSVNVTGRRDFFKGVTAMGFPHCESIDEISVLLKSINTLAFRERYEQAIKNYNEMTDREE